MLLKPTMLILHHSKYEQTKVVLPGYLGFGTSYVQGEYISDICTFTEVPILTSADNKSEKYENSSVSYLKQNRMVGRSHWVQNYCL